MKFTCSLTLALSLSALLPRAVRADDVFVAPGQKATEQQQDEEKKRREEQEKQSPTSAPGYPNHFWDLPPIEVVGEAKPELKEEELVGSYKQPRWTAQRRFPTTRMYVVPEGKVEFEWWCRYTAPFADPGREREVRSYYEMEFGLGHRLQFDVYLVTQQEGMRAMELKREQAELRYALADWGKIWGNPTLYLEWQHRHDENDRLEGKILIGGQIVPRVHAGFNLVLEREIGGAEENEWNLTGGVSYSAIDSVLSVGVEGYVEVHDVKNARWKYSDTEQLFLAGPSIAWNPIPPARFLISPLFGSGQADGTSGRQAMFRMWFVAGWTF